MKRVLSLVLAVLMLVSLLPVTTFAAVEGLSPESELVPDHMTVTQDKVSTLAPGVIQHEVALYDKYGDRVEMLVAIADMSVETVNIYANYKDNQNQVLGMQKTTEQVAAAVAKHQGENYNPVVAINASYYNTNNGTPSGAFVMEGVDASVTGQDYPFFAVLKDGTVMIGAKGEYATYKDQLQEAIGGYIHLVKDGKLVGGLNDVAKYPRQTIGITADNKVVIMTSDGNQAPVSNGMTIKEQAEVMLAMGCVEALHLDGGGSATYCAKPEGTDKLVVLNSPSNGSERAVSNTLMIVSTAAPDGEFHHASLTVENEYVTPGTAVDITAIGVDAAGGAAEIPENAVWQLADNTYGTVDAGKFVSNGKTGDAQVQMLMDGEVVGDVTIHIVIPTGLQFSKQDNVVPYGKTVKLDLTATYGAYTVAMKEDDLSFALGTEGAGSFDGFNYTSPAQETGITSTIMTATFLGTELTASSHWSFGRGSEVIFDFEEGTAGADMDNWVLRTHESDSENNEQGELYVVNAETGMVRNGNQALAFNIDFSQTTGSGSSTAGYLAMSIGWNGDAINIKGAQSMGFWMYIPDDAMATEITMNAFYRDAKGVVQRRTKDAYDNNGTTIYTPYWKDNMEKSGWHYVEVDLSKFADDLFIHDEPSVTDAYKRNFFIKIYCVFGADTIDLASFHGDHTFYIDDITVDYSSATDDRELPVIDSGIAYGEMEGVTAQLNYGATATATFNKMMFAASVRDNMRKSNYTGIDATSAQIYVDGVAVPTTVAAGNMTSEYVTLANGLHTVTYKVADNAGNVKEIVRKIDVQADSQQPTIQLVAKDPSLDRLLSGSVYWLDLVATDLSKVESVEVLLNLNSTNKWELDHMEVAQGFTATYTATAAMKAEYNVLVKFERNGEKLDGSNVLASLPVRVWESLIHLDKGHESKTPEYVWKAGEIDARDVRVSVDMGAVTFEDGLQSTFSGFVRAAHESYIHYYAMDKAYHTEKGSYHVHIPEAMENMKSTCTKVGYTDRTYCAGCDSVVDWGTTLAATGHTYVLTEDQMVCHCGEILDGEGLYHDENAGVYRYVLGGKVATGWKLIDNDWYYFAEDTKAAANGAYTYDGVDYEFEETGKLTTGIWVETAKGTRYYYGPDYYHEGTNGVANIKWAEIDGNTYGFDKNGYRYEGKQIVQEPGVSATMYEFSEDGVLVGKTNNTGIFTAANGKIYYLVDGVSAGAGLMKIDGDYYYFRSNGNAATGTYFVYNTNGIVDRGNYEFGADGKMLNPPVEEEPAIKDGLVEENGELYYYVNGERQLGAGLVEIDGSYYYIRSNGNAATGTYFVYNTNGLVERGDYEFGADGKMLNPPVEEEPAIKDGLVEENGELYYYVNGERQLGAGLVEIDGSYYYIRSNGNAATGTYFVYNTNGLVARGDYEFGADGKLLTEI